MPRFLDLDEADDPSIPVWQKHGSFHVLKAQNGTAILYEPTHGTDAVGLLLYADGVTFPLAHSTLGQLVAAAENALRERPASDNHLLLDLGEEPPPVEKQASPPAPSPGKPLPSDVRIWTTTPLSRGLCEDCGQPPPCYCWQHERYREG